MSKVSSPLAVSSTIGDSGLNPMSGEALLLGPSTHRLSILVYATSPRVVTMACSLLCSDNLPSGRWMVFHYWGWRVPRSSHLGMSLVAINRQPHGGIMEVTPGGRPDSPAACG